MARGWVILTWQPKQAWLICPKKMPVLFQQLQHKPRVLRLAGDPGKLNPSPCFCVGCGHVKHQQMRKLVLSCTGLCVFQVLCCFWGWERDIQLSNQSPSWIFIYPSSSYNDLYTWRCASVWSVQPAGHSAEQRLYLLSLGSQTLLRATMSYTQSPQISWCLLCPSMRSLPVVWG